MEQKIGLGYAQLTIISKFKTDDIVNKLQTMKYGVTILPGEGGSGEVSIAVLVAPRKFQKKILNVIDQIDPDAFITIQHSLPYRGFMHGSRK